MRKLELGETLRIGELELTVVESLRIEHEGKEGLWCFATRAPVAVLVKGASRATRAYGMDGQPVSLEALRDRLPPELWRAAGIAG